MPPLGYEAYAENFETPDYLEKEATAASLANHIMVGVLKNGVAAREKREKGFLSRLVQKPVDPRSPVVQYIADGIDDGQEVQAWLQQDDWSSAIQLYTQVVDRAPSGISQAVAPPDHRATFQYFDVTYTREDKQSLIDTERARLASNVIGTLRLIAAEVGIELEEKAGTTI
jgi:hypothetical protein